MPRPFDAVMKDLNTAVTDIQDKQKKKEAATKALEDASKAYDDAQIAATAVREEITYYLSMLTPSGTGRVRVSD